MFNKEQLVEVIPLAKADIVESDVKAVLEVLRSSTLALGPKLDAFEKNIAEYVGVRYAVATNSGTSVLHLILWALGIGSDDEVITTLFSFVASSNCIFLREPSRYLWTSI